MTRPLTIVPFEEQYAKHFKDLNVAWLEKFFEVEPYDKELLENCQGLILDKGGFIFFGLVDKQVIGTLALIKLENGVYELVKMAVDEAFQGKGYGNELLRFIIHFSEKHHWDKLLLYSNTVLENSIHLYRKFGFLEIPMENDTPYKRGNIKMELPLKA